MAKVKSIEFIGNEDVYNMEVENHHNFAVNGGCIVHNCDAIRYFVAGRPRPTALAVPELSGVYAYGELKLMGYTDAQIRKLRDKVKIIGKKR